MSNRRRQQKQTGVRPADWDFFSFPVFAAFVAGIFLTCLFITFDIGGYVGVMHPLLWYVSLIGISFSGAHIATRLFARYRQGRRREREEEEERERRALAARARAAEPGPPPEEAHRRRRRRHRRS